MFLRISKYHLFNSNYNFSSLYIQTKNNLLTKQCERLYDLFVHINNQCTYKQKGGVYMDNNLSMLMGRDRVSALKLSKETGISRTSIHGLYHERTENPDTKTVMKLCEYFNVTPNEFFGINEKEEVK